MAETIDKDKVDRLQQFYIGAYDINDREKLLSTALVNLLVEWIAEDGEGEEENSKFNLEVGPKFSAQHYSVTVAHLQPYENVLQVVAR